MSKEDVRIKRLVDNCSLLDSSRIVTRSGVPHVIEKIYFDAELSQIVGFKGYVVLRGVGYCVVWDANGEIEALVSLAILLGEDDSKIGWLNDASYDDAMFNLVSFVDNY